MTKDILTRKDQTCDLWIQRRAEENRYVRKYLQRILSYIEDRYLEAYRIQDEKEYILKDIIDLMHKDAPHCSNFPKYSNISTRAKRLREED